MTAKTIAQRVADLRARREALGLTRLELWARPEDHEYLKAKAEWLQKRRERRSKASGT
jgi:hypothetical protein